MTMCKRNAKADWSQTKNKNKKRSLSFHTRTEFISEYSLLLMVLAPLNITCQYLSYSRLCWG